MISQPQIVLVASEADQAEIRAVLQEHPWTFVWVGAGGQSTLSQLAAQPRPQAAILCGELPNDDPQDVLSNLRETLGASVGVVFIAGRSGPFRNALDVRGLSIDQFVGRPLSETSLAYALRSVMS